MAGYPAVRGYEGPEARDERGLSAALTMAHERADNLEGLVGRLAERLSPVLLAQAPTTEVESPMRGGIAEDQGPHQSDLHKRTAALETRLRRLAHTLGDLVERVDL